MEKFHKIADHVILNQISTTECQICKVKIASPSVEQSHYNSNKHNSSVNTYREHVITTMVANQNAFPSCNSTKFTVPLIYKKPEIAKSEIFKCGVCKIDLNSESWKETHVKQFPHADLLKLKRETLKKGYKDDLYSLHQGKYIYCHICNVVLQCTSSVKSHCQSAKHQTKFNNLDIPVCEDIPGYLCKWFFCKVCNKNLDGTSHSDSHYDGFYQSYMAVTDVNTAKTDFSAPLVNTIPTTIKVFRDSSVQVDQLGLTELPIEANNLSNSSNNANLKNKVLMELEKLVQTLYYSNKVPLDEALKYIKKVNCEVESIIENAEKNGSDEDQASLQESVENSEVANEIDASNDSTFVDTVSQKSTDKMDEATQPDGGEKQLLDETAGKELGTIPKRFKTIEDLYMAINRDIRKEEEIGCEQKVEVLEEISSLLDLLVHEEYLPWQEILDCLKTFNVTVERETSHFLNS